MNKLYDQLCRDAQFFLKEKGPFYDKEVFETHFFVIGLLYQGMHKDEEGSFVFKFEPKIPRKLRDAVQSPPFEYTLDTLRYVIPISELRKQRKAKRDAQSLSKFTYPEGFFDFPGNVDTSHHPH